jgi:hypothetical protein
VSLLSRVVEATTCRVQGCDRARARDAQVCAADVTELFMNRLDRQPDGSYTRRRTFAARDLTGSLRVA